MIYFLLTLYTAIFTTFSWRRFALALGVFIVALPTYLIRFNIGPLPTTLLELNFGIIFLVWLIKHRHTDFKNIRDFIRSQKTFNLSLLIFFIASLLSIFVGNSWFASLGSWRAYFLEPIILFFILIGRKEKISTNNLILALGLSTVSISVFAIFQQFTGLGIATPEWSAVATRRVTSFFTSPNAIGLFVAPILPLLIAQALKTRRFFTPHTLFFTLSLVAIFFTKSFGTVIGLAAGALVFLFLFGYKKTVISIIILGCIVVSTFNFLLSAKLHSSSNRLILWSYTANFLTSSPTNFILGSGIRQFYQKIQAPNRTTNILEPHIYPHNILLNFWTETGLFGVISFAFIIYNLAFASYQIHKSADKILGASLLSALTIIVTHGLIDVPYFKNDLAMLFWIIAALCFTFSTPRSQHRA